MLCPNCGYDNSPNNRFCVRCGVDLSVAPAQPAAGPPPGSAPSDTAPPPPPSTWGAPPPASQWGAPGSTPPPSIAPPPPAGGPPLASAPPNPFASPPPNPFAPPAPYGPPGAYPPPGAGPYGQYPAPYPPSGYQPPSTNGLAIASLVLGVVGWIPCGAGSIVAIVLGFVARSQIRASQGRQGGDGLALAGIVLGFLAVALWIALLVIGALSSANNGTS